MSKAFTRESEGEEDDELVSEGSPVPPGTKNYMTRAGHRQMREEFERLIKVDRPELVRVVAWAASNGDRSENGDYIYGKKRLREMDRRIRFLTKRLETAEVVDPQQQAGLDRVFFGATVTVCDSAGEESSYQIVGFDEADASSGRISWISPLAKALMKAREGDMVKVQTPSGLRELEVVEISYR